MGTLTELQRKQEKIRAEIVAVAESGDLEGAKQRGLAEVDAAGLDDMGVDWYAQKIRDAASAKKLASALSSLHHRVRNDLKREMKNDNRLVELVDRCSGDSWNGTHSRGISLALDADGAVTVSNKNYDHPADVSHEKFTPEEFVRLGGDDLVRHAYYFSDFHAALSGQQEFADLFFRINAAWNGATALDLDALIAGSDTADSLTAPLPGQGADLLAAAAATEKFADIRTSALKGVDADGFEASVYDGDTAIRWLEKRGETGLLMRPEIWLGRSKELQTLWRDQFSPETRQQHRGAYTAIIEQDKLHRQRRRKFKTLPGGAPGQG